ncbi:MAG: 4'-phosphopantetheinyl transferase [Steroidobacterales bacterium]
MSVSNTAGLSPGFQLLFPAGVIAAELRAPGAVELLLPAEAACLGGSVHERRQEFAAGRLCARRALAEFGVRDFALVAARDRQPVWPASIVGSITHTAGRCAAVVGLRSQFRGLGVDTEVVGRVKAELWPRICVPAELTWIESLPPTQRLAAAALVFAAKEAFYKCQAPVTAEWLGFEDLQIEPSDFEQALGQRVIGEFRATPMRRIALAAVATMPLSGRYGFNEEFVSAGVALGA